MNGQNATQGLIWNGVFHIYMYMDIILSLVSNGHTILNIQTDRSMPACMHVQIDGPLCAIGCRH